MPSAVNYLQQELAFISTGLGLVAEQQQNRGPSWRSSVHTVKLELALRACTYVRVVRALGAAGSRDATLLRTHSRPAAFLVAAAVPPPGPRRGSTEEVLLPEKGAGNIILSSGGSCLQFTPRLPCPPGTPCVGPTSCPPGHSCKATSTLGAGRPRALPRC